MTSTSADQQSASQRKIVKVKRKDKGDRKLVDEEGNELEFEASEEEPLDVEDVVQNEDGDEDWEDESNGDEEMEDTDTKKPAKA